jgi:hypothetical protein
MSADEADTGEPTSLGACESRAVEQGRQFSLEREHGRERCGIMF